MANALIVFTPRSGSTIVAELLAYKYGAVNLDELMMSDIRGVIERKLPNDVRDLINKNKGLSRATELYKSNTSKGLEKVYEYNRKRLELVKQINQIHPIVLKTYPSIPLPGITTIEWAIEKNFDIFFLQRRNVINQLYSYFLANTKEEFYKNAKKAGKLEIEKYAGFLNTKSTPRVVFPQVHLEKNRIIELVAVFNGFVSMHQCLLEKYKKYGKQVYYEDTIVRNDFSPFGITQNIVDEYVKHPLAIQSTYEYTVGSQFLNWDEVVSIFKEFSLVSYE